MIYMLYYIGSVQAARSGVSATACVHERHRKKNKKIGNRKKKTKMESNGRGSTVWRLQVGVVDPSIARACDLGAPLKVDMRERRSCLRKASRRQIGKLITSPEIQPSELAHMAYV